jgi:hypothetical protein
VLKSNSFCFSIDSVSGESYIFLNNKIVCKFDIKKYKYGVKQLLYGDFYILIDGSRYDLLKYNNEKIIKNIYVSDQYLDSSSVYLLDMDIQKIEKIETIYITLPCGMRNNIDDISILSNIENSTSFKSNKVNIIFKNIDNTNLQGEFQNYIIEELGDLLPINTNINTIEYKNYK